MPPHRDELQLTDGTTLSPANLAAWRNDGSQQPDECRAELASFLQEWWSDSPEVKLQSSGSAGAPKQFTALKRAMRASARLSCDYLQLHEGQSVLLRLPMTTIAAKMMIVRCIIAGMKLCLRPASSRIWAGLPSDMRVDFAPLVSLQIAQSSDEELDRIGTILLGGGLVPPAMEERLRQHAGRVYASYGMTETLSHIALRCLNGCEASPAYTPLAGVELSLDKESCLVITARHLDINKMATTDIADIYENGTFRILGRRDNIINSGGVKLQAEEIEEILHHATGLQLVAIAQPHDKLGNCVALLWEGEPSDLPQLQAAIENKLSPYQRPKQMRWVAQIPRTSSGKIARAEARKLASTFD